MKRVLTEIGLFLGGLVIHDVIVGSLILLALGAMILYGVMEKTYYRD